MGQDISDLYGRLSHTVTKTCSDASMPLGHIRQAYKGARHTWRGAWASSGSETDIYLKCCPSVTICRSKVVHVAKCLLEQPKTTFPSMFWFFLYGFHSPCGDKRTVCTLVKACAARACWALLYLSTQESHVGTVEVPVLLAFCSFERTFPCFTSCKATLWVTGAAGPCWEGSSPHPLLGEQLLKSSTGSCKQKNWHSKAFSSEAQIASPHGKEVSLLIWPIFCYFKHIPRSDLFPSIPYGVDMLLLLCCPYKTFHYS